ncbi:MAG: virulence-associated E family protein [Clostridiales bacterium]|nr:virulence-associated E family protein [Clostridiales bacterium]
MINDRKITISVGENRKSVNWKPQTLLLSEFYERLRIPARSTETVSAYLAMKKVDQDNLKDVGGFVAGSLTGTRRKASAVAGRDVVTLDLDAIPPGSTADILRRVEALGCGYCIYSTRKHAPSAPRLRILLPLDRTATADEYEPLARKMAEYIGMQLADPTTFDVSRLMYWPSVCADGEYIYTWQDKPLLSVDGLLALYEDWHNVASWARHGGEIAHTRLAVKQGDPTAKTGVVGAFCRSYGVCTAMDEFLPGIYDPMDNLPDRYTFLGGSTTGGAVVYDDGKWLYSHHATDPCGGKLVNAFDLIRLHMFGDKDETADPNMAHNRLPSYLAMMEFAQTLPPVVAELARERHEKTSKDFEGISQQPESGQTDTLDWMGQLEINSQTNVPKATINNCLIILENDPLLKGRFSLNRFSGRGELLGAVPWVRRGASGAWDDTDLHGLYWYFEHRHKITGTGKIDAALSLHAAKHSYNPVTDFLDAQVWDGVPRLDTLFMDYLGALDTPYIRAVTRKAFVAAVARAYTPGCKFDCMVILASAQQGIGKSTLLDKMSRGFFNDSIRTFEGKEAFELLQGIWLVEVAELDAFRTTEVSRVKQFLSLRIDRFRAAYGRTVQDMPRTCVLFGTANTFDYLQDRTGNRRFWPVDCGKRAPSKSIWEDLDAEIPQLWAEAVVRYRADEALFLSGELLDSAVEEQEDHRDRGAKEGIVREFLAQQVPKDWRDWSIDRRKVFWGGGATGDIKLAERDMVCVAEVWTEVFNGRLQDLKTQESREIAAIIAVTEGWERAGSMRFGKDYGIQKGFKRHVTQGVTDT